MAWIKSGKIICSNLLVVTLCIVSACTVSYKFNGSSINYEKTKTI